MKLLIDALLPELKTSFTAKGIQGFRATQVYQCMMAGVGTFEEMGTLSKQLRKELAEQYTIGLPKVHSVAVSSIDGTRKYVLELYDGNLIECVLMRYKHGISACISSQVGCRMGCQFCASTGIAFDRNLSGGEMLGQLIVMQKDVGERIGSVVVMGIGEALDNYDEFIRFLKLVNAPDGLNIGYRHITVSTCGLVGKILKLAEEGLPINLSISLHASDDETRCQIMPVNQSYSIDKLMHGCKIYIEKTKRRVMIEYALMKGLNDSVEAAMKLAKLLKGMMCLVNVIPINEVLGTGFLRTSKSDMTTFVRTLENAGIEVTVRRELGSDISAACGQLRKDKKQNGDME